MSKLDASVAPVAGPGQDDRSVGRDSVTGDAGPALRVEGGKLLRRGAPHRVLSGSIHYFRVHPDQWRDRLVRLQDMGLNTIDTYVPWNFHRPRIDAPADFTGWRDMEGFVALAGDLGLDVIVRPGPYICAEWSNGGLPSWLTATPMSLRSSDPRFLEPVADWFDELIPRLARLQAVHGGPVVAVQVENEFGSFGDDTRYLEWLAERLRSTGISELLYTADGPTPVMLDGGTLDGVFTTVTLGSKPDEARAMLSSRRPDEPFFTAEYWNGWFDHWGHPHHVRPADNAAATLRDIVADEGSVSIYMAHGGTNFGLWAGANHVDGELRPTISSYDSDAPVAEDGTLTTKFFAMRDVLGATAPIRSVPPVFLPPRSVEITAGHPLDEALSLVSERRTASTPAGTSFEDLGLDGGMVRYVADILLPEGEVDLHFRHVADRAIVSVDGVRIGTVTGEGMLRTSGRGLPARLSVLVESLGRVNYGHGLGEPKGLLGPVLVERRAVQNWHVDVIDIAALSGDRLQTLGSGPDQEAAGTAGVAVARFDIPEALDTHLALPGFGKGFVWINDFLLGRYWEVGPQQTLYVPGPLLTTGENVVTVLELERRGSHLELRESPELGPTELYIEEF